MNTAVTTGIVASLAHPSTDPITLIARAQRALGWQGSDFLVGLQSYDELMATLQVATDLEGLVRIGDPTSPPLRLLRALNAAHPDLRLSRVTSLDSPWRWTRLGGGSGDASGVALRQQTYSDVVGELGRAGVAFRVLPNDTTTEEILRIGREIGSAVVDVDELEPDGILIIGFLETLEPITYGLLSREHVDPGADAVVWLSISAEHEAAGTLMTALEQFSALGPRPRLPAQRPARPWSARLLPRLPGRPVAHRRPPDRAGRRRLQQSSARVVRPRPPAVMVRA